MSTVQHSISIVTQVLALIERIDRIQRQGGDTSVQASPITSERVARVLADVMAYQPEPRELHIAPLPRVRPPGPVMPPRPVGKAVRIVRRLGVSPWNFQSVVHAHGRPVVGSWSDTERHRPDGSHGASP
jgi:hypothetical protein